MSFRRYLISALLGCFGQVLFVSATQAATLEAAFTAVRKGNLQPIAQAKVTAKQMPELTRYLHDPNASVRREAAVLLTSLGASTCSALTEALVDSDADNRERAARSLHQLCPDIVKRVDGSGKRLRESIRLGNTSAYAFAMLGRSVDEVDKQFVLSHLGDSKTMVKREPASPPVSIEVAATFAAVVMGQTEGVARLPTAMLPISNAEFFAASLGEIDDRSALLPKALAALAGLLDDRRSVSAGVPSGALPRRRVCDIAADQVIAKLQLHSTIALRVGEAYSDAELQTLKRQFLTVRAASPPATR
ncbi:MAG: hypothetical protein ABIZ64_03255 [Casimicrobium sp.]